MGAHDSDFESDLARLVPERLEAGQTFEIEARDGDECGAGAACACGDLGDQQLSVWGRF